MTAIRTVSALGVAAMTIALIYGFSSGDFSGEGGQILDLIWGRITLIDLYVGVAIIAAFVFWGTGPPPSTCCWRACGLARSRRC